MNSRLRTRCCPFLLLSYVYGSRCWPSLLLPCKNLSQKKIFSLFIFSICDIFIFTSLSGVRGLNDMKMRKMYRVFENAVITQGRKPVKIRDLKPITCKAFNDDVWAQKLKMDIVSPLFRNLFVTQVMILSRFRFFLSGPKWKWK
jgi:hypothetical protein